jgi:hypothetical protein
MAITTEEFFADLGQRKHVPLLEGATGTIGFDLMRDTLSEHWLLAVSNGDVSVSRDMTDADCHVRADRELFDRILLGEEYLQSALLRGVVALEGNLEWVFLFERLLPGPQGPRQRRAVAEIGRHP